MGYKVDRENSDLLFDSAQLANALISVSVSVSVSVVHVS